MEEEKLLHRYNRRPRYTYAAGANRYRLLLIAAILGVVMFLFIRLMSGGQLNESNFINHRNARIRNEMQHALTSINALSSAGGTTSSSVLGRIRQYVHGIELLNDLNVSMYGEVGRLYDLTIFDDIYSLIDAYDAKLASGQKVNDSMVLLREAINRLNDVTNQEVLGH